MRPHTTPAEVLATFLDHTKQRTRYNTDKLYSKPRDPNTEKKT